MHLVAAVLDSTELGEPLEVVNALMNKPKKQMKIRSTIYNRGKKH